MNEAGSSTGTGRFSALMEAAVDGVIVIDAQGRIEAFNRSAERIFGYDRSETVGHNVSMLMPEPDRGHHDGYLERYLSGGEPHIIGIGREVEGRRKDGSTFPLELSVGEVAAPERGFVGILRDISERRTTAIERARLEAEARETRDLLAHAGRLEILGEMTAAIAHEINQPLTAIASYSEAASRMLASDDFRPEDARPVVDKITAQAQRAAEVIRRLRALVTHRPSERTAVAVDDLVDDALVLVEGDLRRRGFSLQRQLEAGVPAVAVDAIQIQQVLLNLLRNAADAMSSVEGGGVTIYTAARDDGQVEIGVVDAGSGIGKSDEEHIFDPFFSTKNEGLGLGLSLCRSILQAHGGDVSFRRNTTRGTTFFLHLPAVEEEPQS